MIDTEILLEISKMKDDIIEAVKKIIDDSNKLLTKYLKEINMLQFDAIEKDIERHKGYHEMHFAEIKANDDKITKSRESILKEVELKLEKHTGKTRTNVGTIISIIAVTVSVLAVILSNI